MLPTSRTAATAATCPSACLPDPMTPSRAQRSAAKIDVAAPLMALVRNWPSANA
jgi:hypothetical protein